VCRRIAGNDADAQDCAQEAMIAITRGLPRYTGEASFRTWSYRVATNASLDELRRRKRRPTPSVVDEHPEMVDRLERDDTPGLQDQVTDRLILDDALAQLPEDFRAPIILRDQCGMDYADIATTLDLAPGTVRSRIARGRSKLAKLVTDGNQPALPERQSSDP